MSTTNHTPTAANGGEMLPADVTTPDASLDAAIGDRTTLSTSTKTSAVAAINEVIGTFIGSLAGLSTTVKSSVVAAINEVFTTAAANAAGLVNLTTRVAGSLDSGGVLKANTVGTSQITDANITGAKIAAAAIDVPSIVWAYDNMGPGPERHFNGRSRWYVGTGRPEQSLSLSAADVDNPYGTPTLVFTSGTSTQAGKRLYINEMQAPIGSAVLFAAEWRAASGTYQLKAQCVDASDVAVGSAVASGVVTGDTTIQTTVLPSLTIQATTSYVRIWWQRVSGSAAHNTYHLWGAKGQYLASTPPKRLLSTLEGASGRPGIVWDPMFNENTPGNDVGGRLRWGHPELLSVIPNNVNSPWGGTSLRATTAAATAQVSKRIYLDEAGLSVGDTVGFAALVTLDSPNGRMRVFWIDATNAVLSTTDGDYVSSSGSLQYLYTPNTAIPASTTSIAVVVELGYSGVARNTEIHALWGGRDGIVDAWPMPCPIPSVTQEIRAIGSRFGSERLRSWRYWLAKHANSSSDQADIIVLGDSWIEHAGITTPLRTQLQSAYGNAGGGYIDFGSTFQNSSAYWEFLSTAGGATTRTGTWTDTLRSDAASRGLSLTDMRTTDLAATAKFTTTVAHTGVRIYSHKRSGGGTFQYRIDGGSWTSVDTDSVTAGTLTTTITGLSSATHLIEFQITVAGSAGVTLLGMDLRTTTAGVRVHKAGISGSDVLNWTAVDATLWESALTAIGGGDLVVIVLGTNDRARTAFPSNFGAGLQTIITRIRTVLPYADIMLLTPAEAATGILPFGGYEAAVRGVAAANKHTAYLSGAAMIGAYSESSLITGMWADTAHLSADGFRMLADASYAMLKVP